jgi:hypothetical protein
MLELASLGDSRRELLLGAIRSALDTVLLHYRRDQLDRWSERFPIWESVLSRLKDDSLSTLTRVEAEACLDALHITQYSLGPFELSVITGFTLREYASAGLLLFDQLWPIYTGTLWTEDGGWH